MERTNDEKKKTEVWREKNAKTLISTWTYLVIIHLPLS